MRLIKLTLAGRDDERRVVAVNPEKVCFMCRDSYYNLDGEAREATRIEMGGAFCCVEEGVATIASLIQGAYQ